jgi:hypothetical protein
MEIDLHTLTGRNKGRPVELDLDVVYVIKPDGTKRKIGFIPKTEGGVLRFIRFLPPDVREELRKMCAAARHEQGGEAIAERTSSIPNPRKIAWYLREKAKGRPTRTKKKTTIWTPEGVDNGSTGERTGDAGEATGTGGPETVQDGGD